ncbi:hypothetical protein ACFLR0_01590, partial [Candidatus Bipolaricaulota bacterium]
MSGAIVPKSRAAERAKDVGQRLSRGPFARLDATADARVAGRILREVGPDEHVWRCCGEQLVAQAL